MLVDYVVLTPDQLQATQTFYEPALFPCQTGLMGILLKTWPGPGGEVQDMS